MKHMILSVVLATTLTGCDLIPEGLKHKPATPETTVVSGGTVEGQIRPQARPNDQLAEPTTQAVHAAGDLGTTVVSLGSPAETGLWLKTPLVRTQRAGKVHYKGKAIDVTLIPIAGERTAGSRLSLQGFQTLGAPLTELIEVKVSQ